MGNSDRAKNQPDEKKPLNISLIDKEAKGVKFEQRDAQINDNTPKEVDVDEPGYVNVDKGIDSQEHATYIPGDHILAGEEGILIKRENGHLELGEDVKEKIIRAFKEKDKDRSSPEDARKITGPHILMRYEKTGEEGKDDEETRAAVRVIEEDMKAKKEESEFDIESATDTSNAKLIIRIKKESPNLTQAEAVMVKGPNYAVGLDYKPGRIPVIVALGKGKKAHWLMDCAFKLDIPVVEVHDWNTGNFKQIDLGQEIPENMYPSAARVLALIYRMKPDAYFVRYVKPYKKVRSKHKPKVRKRFREFEDILRFSLLTVEVGEELYKYRKEMEKQLELTSSRLSAEMGFPIPKVSIQIVEDLRDGEYLLKVKEMTHDAGTLNLSYEPPDLFYPLQSSFRSIVYDMGGDLLGYPEVESLLESVKKTNPGLVKSLFPSQFTVGALRFVLRGLLAERIPIRDMTTILQTIEEHISHTTDPELLIEYIRTAFSHFISNAYRDKKGNLNVILLSAEVERKIMESIKESMNIRWLDMKYDEGLEILTNIGNEMKSVREIGMPAVILTSPIIRRFIRKITETNFPGVPVLSYSEITPMTPVKTVGIVKMGKK